MHVGTDPACMLTDLSGESQKHVTHTASRVCQVQQGLPLIHHVTLAHQDLP